MLVPGRNHDHRTVEMTARDIRYQAAVVHARRLLLLYCIPCGEAGFWVLPGGGRQSGESAEACVAREVREEAGIEVSVGPLLYDTVADPPDGTYERWRTYLCGVTRGEATPGGGEGWAELTAVQWLPLDEPAAWESALGGDPFLRPQLRRIVAALPYADASSIPPAGY
jgi:8-oxo-dGTP pyrophosphatase MutT (NUDIX family)